MSSSAHILLVDDEPDILDFLDYNLSKEGYKVSFANSGAKAIDISKRHAPDLILLDVMMPDLDGIETCRVLREIPELHNTIIAFLTARNEDYSQIAGFDAGADDYINKPIKPRVLVSRIKALLRRKANSKQTQNNIIEVGNLMVDKDSYTVQSNGVEIQLPKKEFDLLVLLTSRPEHVFKREVILSSVWGNDVVVGDRTIDVHIRKLREKLGDNSIRTVKGVGYKFTV